MKKIYKSFILLTGILISGFTFAGVHQVNVQASAFAPNLINAEVGDTIIWTWLGGIHTTTSSTIPAGAASWDSPITSTVPAFGYQVTEVGTYNYLCTAHGFTGQIIVTNTSGISTPDVSVNFNIYTVQPSVYNVSYSLVKPSDVKISVYDITGKSVKVLESANQNAGDHLNTYYLDDMQNGIYLIEIIAGNQRLAKRIIIE